MTDNIIIYRQILPKHCVTLAQLGYRSIINIRPDNECNEQPSHAQMSQSAQSAKLGYGFIPCVDDVAIQQNIEQFVQLYHELPKPILMYCGTGFRAKKLYQMAVMKGLI